MLNRIAQRILGFDRAYISQGHSLQEAIDLANCIKGPGGVLTNGARFDIFTGLFATKPQLTKFSEGLPPLRKFSVLEAGLPLPKTTVTDSPKYSILSGSGKWLSSCLEGLRKS